jgi:hypothetical protein
MTNSEWWANEIKEALREPWGLPKEITDGRSTILVSAGRVLKSDDDSFEQLMNEIEAQPPLTPEQEKYWNENPTGDWLK